MPTLDWIGKKVVLNHHREVPSGSFKTSDELNTLASIVHTRRVKGDHPHGHYPVAVAAAD